MPEQLFLVSIGPVQEFIAAARRSRDLWFGSWVLSELAKAAARTIAGAPWEGSLIFPAFDQVALQDEGRSAPNRILAEIDAGVSPADLGEAVLVALRARMGDLEGPALRGEWPKDRPFLEQLARAQIQDLLDGLVFWATTPLEPDYPAARRRLEDLMAGRKMTRAFGRSPVALVSDPNSLDGLLRLPKSTLDGTRESVIDERQFAQRRDDRDTRKAKATLLYNRYGARPAERMSGVDLLKRRGSPGAAAADIPSTSHFAALPLLQRSAGPGSAQTFARQLAKLTSYGARPEQLAERYHNSSLIGGYDAGILFPERLVEEVDKADLAEARGALADLLDAATDGKAPEPYYALLAADGDFMGDTIDRFATAEAHRQFSLALSSFAAGVRKVVEEDHQGALVFAGGDDVLAFLPLHTVLDCAQQLAAAFQKQIGAAIARMPKDAFLPLKAGIALPPSPSLSVGIAIAHHIEPLADTLQLAGEAERLAKSLPGKNALAITLSKRSGVDRSVSGRWGNLEDGDGSTFLTRLRNFIALHREEAIPDGAAYELRDLAERLGRAPEGLRSALEPAMRSNAIGIFERKRGRRGEKKVTANVIADLSVALDPAAPEPIGVATLADELIIARTFARALGPKSPAIAAAEGAS